MTTTELTGAEDVAWDLTDIYESPDDAALETDVGDARSSATRFRERYAGRVSELDAAELREALAELERIHSVLTRAGAYSYMRFSTNTAEPARGALLQRIQELGAALDAELLFFRLEWTALRSAGQTSTTLIGVQRRERDGCCGRSSYRPSPASVT